MLIRTTIWLFLLGLGAPAYALEHTPSQSSLAQTPLPQPSLAQASQGWWGSAAERTRYQLRFLSGAPDSWQRLEPPYRRYFGTDYATPPRAFASVFRQRLLSTPGNSYLEAGIGIQNIEYDRREYANSMRFSLGGRIGFGTNLSLYGESAWLTGVAAPRELNSLTGVEFETGLMLQALPFLSIRAAYRRFSLNYSLTDGVSDDATLQGFVIGTGIRW